MKRACVLILLVVFCIVGFLSIWGGLPFTAVSGSAMAPELRTGDLLLIASVAPDAVKEGDIVVYNVPDYLRERHNYPPVITHRVAEVIAEDSVLWLRTLADNIGDDPFLVRLLDIRGTVSGTVPYLGYPLLLFRGGTGTVLFIIAIILLALIMYAREIAVRIGRLLRTTVVSVVEENQQVRLDLSYRFDATERALDGFADAVRMYAQHLASHTSAIQGLRDASQALKGSATEQNRILGHLSASIIRERKTREAYMVERVVREFARKTAEALEARDELEKRLPESGLDYREIIPIRDKRQSPPGCAASPKALLARHRF
ncbi:MAG TPA: signal peptidase I [Dehalococcoidia bacterium]|nr:signal peptidase I [Dehalococcoidia bacterium]